GHRRGHDRLRGQGREARGAGRRGRFPASHRGSVEEPRRSGRPRILPAFREGLHQRGAGAGDVPQRDGAGGGLQGRHDHRPEEEGMREIAGSDGRILSREECQELLRRAHALAEGGGETQIHVTSWWHGELRWGRNRVTLVTDRRNVGLVLARAVRNGVYGRSEEHTSELQSRENLVCRLLLEKKKK